MSPVSTADLLADRYRLDHQLEAGEIGEVWRGTDLQLARTVAVRLLGADADDARAAEQFRVAACRAAAVVHEGLVGVFDYCEPDQPDCPHGPFLVMEYVRWRVSG